MTAQIDLVFGTTHAPAGFTNPALSQFDASPEPVVRELLQNSVDAADKADRPCEVRFVYLEVDAAEIPNWDSYRAKFDAAKRDRTKRDVPPTHDEATIIARIEAMADAPRVPLLLCIDNGIGLTPQRMDSLLTPGNSDKGAGGAGSFGLGHLAPFSASDLRYVLYASRYADDDGDERVVASGQAILATHMEHDEHGKPTRHVSADGFRVVLGQQTLMFSGDGSQYPAEVSPLLQPYLDALGSNGTIVCITGFNSFQRDEDDPEVADSILQVAAGNFVDAIVSGQLTVTVDQVSDDGTTFTAVLDDDSIERVLAPLRERKVAAKAGQISGVIANQALDTLRGGRSVVVNESDGDFMRGISVRWLPHAEGVRATTRVILFRKGMWIASATRYLEATQFSRQPGFTAVLSLRQGQLEELVRSAEGPEHRGLETKRLTNQERQELKRLMEKIAVKLRDEVGEKEDIHEFTPEDFMMVDGSVAKQLESVKPKRSLSPTGPKPDPSDRRPPNPRPKPRKRAAPRAGTRLGYRYVLRAAEGDTEIEAEVDLGDDSARYIGVRLVAPNGSDETCEAQLPTRFVPVSSIARTHDDDRTVLDISEPADGGEALLTALSGTQRLKIRLAEPLADTRGLELDIVRRSKPQPKAQENKTQETEPVAA